MSEASVWWGQVVSRVTQRGERMGLRPLIAARGSCESSHRVEAMVGSDVTVRRQIGQKPPALSVFMV